MSDKPVAIIAGIGSGTGSSIARRFAKAYAVVLLARQPSSYEPLEQEIKSAGGEALGISADVSDPQSIDNAFRKIEAEWNVGKGRPVAAAIYNAGARVAKPFLELTLEDYEKGSWEPNKGSFLFAKYTIPLLLQSTDLQHPPTLIFSGATASIKGNAKSAAFATGKWALRALAQSLAREFGPQGIHVAHAILDGHIDIPKHKDRYVSDIPDAKINPDAIADSYWYLHSQPRTTFTHEIDIRPYVEKW